MDKKHPKEMTCGELYTKLCEDSRNEQAAKTIQDSAIDGELLWLMVDDFTEFSAIITNPVERLRLKQFVQKYQLTKITSGKPSSEQHTPPVVVNDDQPIESDISSMSSLSDEEMDWNGEAPRESTPKRSINKKKRSLACNAQVPPAKRLPSQKRDKNDQQQAAAGSGTIALPDRFSRRVTTAIETGQLFAENRSAFVRECVDFWEPILPSPSKQHFRDLSTRLCDKYPSLRDAKKTEYWSTLKDQISQRYRNNRRRTPATKSHKVTLPGSSGESSVPAESAGDHEIEEYEENVDALKKISKTKSPPAQTVQELLKDTRKHRQEWLSSAPVSIHDILEKYPVFENPKWLTHEFNCLMEGKDMLETMETNWRQVCEALGDGPKTSEKEVLLKIEKNVYHRKTASPVVIAEASGDINEHFKHKIMEPRLVVFEDEGAICQVFICGENENLMEVPGNTISIGIAYLMASYYVFGIQYPKPYQPLLYFFQDFVMDLPDNAKRPTRYASFAASIKFTCDSSS